LTAQSGESLTVALKSFNQTTLGTTLAILTNGAGTITVTGSAGANVSNTVTGTAPIQSPNAAAYSAGAFVTYGLYDYATLILTNGGTNYCGSGINSGNYFTN
jgi:hypothetical protein